MSSIIDDSLSNLSDLDSEHILDLSEVGEEEIATFSEAIQEVIVGVSSINGMTGDVTLTAGDLNAYTKDQANNLFATKQDITVTIDGVTYTTSQQFADFVYQSVGEAFSQVWEELDKTEKKSNRATSISESTADNYHYPTTKAVYDLFDSIPEDIIINITYDAQTQKLHWNGADSIADVQNAFEAGGSVTVFAPVLSDEVYRVGWLRSIGPGQLDLMSIDDSWAMDKISLIENNKLVSLTTVDLQQRLTAGNNISISGSTISATVPTKTSELVNDSGYITVSNGGIAIVLAYDSGTGNFTWSGADSLAAIKSAHEAGTNIVATVPDMTTESYTIIELEWGDNQHTSLVGTAYDSTGPTNIDFAINSDLSATFVLTDIQKRLTAGSGINISGTTISANIPTQTSQLTNNGSDGTSTYVEASQLATVATSGSYNDLQDKPTIPSPITVDTALSSSSTNPVQNQALYPAIVPTEVYKTVYTYDWTGPAGTNLYDCVAILTMPNGTFTNNSLIELVNEDSFNTFAQHGFVLYGSEVSSQRLWITSIGKPTGTVSLKFRIYKWGD